MPDDRITKCIYDPPQLASGGGAGSGDVTGGSASSNGEVAVYDGTDGKVLKQSLFIIAGPASTAKTYTFPNASSTILTSNAAVTVGQGGTGVATFALNGVLYGNAASAIGVTAIGAEGQILRVGASPFVPAWTTATFPATAGAAGNALISDGTNWASGNVLSSVPTGLTYTTATRAVSLTSGYMIPGGGSAGQILTSAGASAPAFTTATYPATTTAYKMLVSTATSVVGELAAVGATGEYLAGATGAIPAWATLNQAAVAGLTTASSPVFVTVKCSGLTDGYLPYHVADATGLGNTLIYTDATNIGINVGATVPAARLHVAETITTSPRGIMSGQYSTSSDGARFHMRKARNTLASPVIVVTGDTLGKLVASGWDGAAYQEMGSISIECEGTIAAGRVPTRIVMSTATNAATSVLTERLRIDNTGLMTQTASLIAATGNEVAYSLNYTTLKSSSGNDTGLLISMTDSGSPGTSLGIDYQVGGTSKFSVDNAGVIRTAYGVYTPSADYSMIIAGGGGIYSTEKSIWLQSLGTITSLSGTKTIVGITGNIGAPTGNMDGTYIGLTIEPNYNQTATGGISGGSNYDLVVNRTETAIATGTQRQISCQVGAVEQYGIDNKGIIKHSPVDNTASPVAATGPLNFFGYNKSVADNGVVTMPLVTSAGFGIVIAGTKEEYTFFWVDNDGDVTLLNNTANVVANADTDVKLDIGTAATQEPLQIKNALGATKVINIMFWYD